MAARTQLAHRSPGAAADGVGSERGAAPISNFAAGPGMMPQAVLARARAELLDWHGRGLSVLEMPFTGANFKSIMAKTRADLARLLGVPENYRILFMQGGASAQFSLVPLNLLGGGVADYVDTGHWAKRAIVEGRRYGQIHVAASGAAEGYRRIPPEAEWRPSRNAAYRHITANETADGLEYNFVPANDDAPLVADMTSNLLSRPIEIARYGLIYASAQKNIGPAGLTLVILREDLLNRASAMTPMMFNYRVRVASEDLVNTPPTYAVYLSGLVFEWLDQQGGLEAAARRNARKAARLYAAIDDSGGFYSCPAAPSDRSRVNVCFRLAEPALEPGFVDQAALQGLINLAGHGARGGLRASLYNAMPEAGVEALVGFMADFARRHG